MKGSDLFVKCLENEGVSHIFGVPGEEILDILDSLSRSKIKFKKSFGVRFGNPDFVKLAESFGAKGVRVDYSENMKLTRKLSRDICNSNRGS